MARSRGAAVDVAGIGRQSADVSLEPLPESCAVAIVDWHCAGHDTARGEVELAPTHEVVVPRHGAYLREYRGELSWLDPGTVSFANPGEHYRVRHPAPGGDRCTLFALSRREARAVLGPEARFARPHAPLSGRAYLLHRLALGASRQRWAHSTAGLAAEEYAGAFLRAALAYHRAGRLPRGALVKLYFGGEFDYLGGTSAGVGFGLPPTEVALDAYLAMLGESGLPWSVAVIGGDVVRSGMAGLAIARGGHVRVGLEDHAGSRKPTNVELVEEVVDLAAATGRPVASCAEAAQILDLPRK